MTNSEIDGVDYTGERFYQHHAWVEPLRVIPQLSMERWKALSPCESLSLSLQENSHILRPHV
jgi:hypothetical protein